MTRAVIKVGDVSNHGNVVLRGAPATRIGNIPVAYVGSAVSGDPLPHAPNQIVTPGTAGVVKVGNPGGPYYAVAAAGAGTACGAAMVETGIATKFG